jgi:hypothetical protein
MKENDQKKKKPMGYNMQCPSWWQNLPMQTTNVRKKGNGMIKKLTYKHL